MISCEMQMLTRNYDDAQRTSARLHAIEPEKWLGYYFLARIALLRSGDVKTALSVLDDAQKQIGAEELGAGLTAQEFRSIWPAVLNPEFARYMRVVAEPAEEGERLGYFTSRLKLAVYRGMPRYASICGFNHSLRSAISPRQLLRFGNARRAFPRLRRERRQGQDSRRGKASDGNLASPK